MLDFNVSVQFEPHFQQLVKDKIDRLVVSSCAVHMFSDNRLWSGFDEMTFSSLNENDYGLGVLDIEIGLVGYTGKSYPKFYTKCFLLHTDNNLKIKPMKYRNDASESKVNQRGETVIGIRYFFTNDQEIQLLSSCDRMLFELFIALDKPKNVYGIACQLKKGEDEWSAEYANTFHLDYADNIKCLYD